MFNGILVSAILVNAGKENLATKKQILMKAIFLCYHFLNLFLFTCFEFMCKVTY